MMHPDAAGDKVQGLHNDAGYLLLLHSKDEAWSLYLKEVEKDYVASVHGNHDKYLADATLAFDARTRGSSRIAWRAGLLPRDRP